MQHIHLTQSCTSFVQVEVNGTNYTFLSSEQMEVSLLVKQLSVNFTKGERVSLRAFAVNSVGTSDPVSADVIVPCELLNMIYIVHAGHIGGWSVCMWVLCITLYSGSMVWWYLYSGGMYGPCVALSIHVVYCSLQSLPTSLLPPLN